MNSTINNNIYCFIVRWFFSTNHKIIRRFFNIKFSQCCQLLNFLTTIASFLTVFPNPNSLGKFSMLSWLFNQPDSLVVLNLCLLSEFIMIFTAVLGFSVIYILFKKDQFFLNEVVPYFNKLPLKNKLIFSSFTFFVAIPNRFWIYNLKINFIILIIISAFVYFLALVFPFIFFLYAVYIIMGFESMVFGFLYETVPSFKKVINFILFGNASEPFADVYFKWFWGNMNQAGKRFLKAVVAGATPVEVQRRWENHQKTIYADEQTAGAAKTQQGFQTPDERAAFHKIRRDEWVDENGTVTKGIKIVRDWLNNS